MDHKTLLAIATRNAAAVLFDRQRDTISITRNNGTIARAEWARPEDGGTFAIEGKIVGEFDAKTKKPTGAMRLLWRFKLETNAFGRWRDDPRDELVTVSPSGIVTISGMKP